MSVYVTVASTQLNYYIFYATIEKALVPSSRETLMLVEKLEGT